MLNNRGPKEIFRPRGALFWVSGYPPRPGSLCLVPAATRKVNLGGTYPQLPATFFSTKLIVKIEDKKQC